MNQLEKVSYRGWPNCYRLTNGRIELIITTDVGPRIIHFGFVDGVNEFAVLDATAGLVGGDEWRVYGGHRLWHAPEAAPRTYFPDNQPVKLAGTADCVHLIQPTEPTTGIQKEIELRLDPQQASVQVTHRLTNYSAWPIELAPWALSVMAAGGTAVVPLPPRQSHQESLLPTNTITLWAYTDMSDPRWHWGHKFVLLKQDAGIPTPQKAGFFTPAGWVAYANHGNLFVKTFAPQPDARYPDMNSHVELFVNAQILEVETLGVLEMVGAGTAVTHTETWRLFPNVPQPQTENDVAHRIVPKIQSTDFTDYAD